MFDILNFILTERVKKQKNVRTCFVFVYGRGGVEKREKKRECWRLILERLRAAVIP